MILVRLACDNCGRLLGKVDTAPTDWTGSFTIKRCQKCYVPSPGRLVEFLRDFDVPAYGLVLEVPWESVRHDVELAQKTRKTRLMKVRDPGPKALP